MSEVVTRFAPSPTGYLHIGGARTALFNWLFARHHGGTFLLRIEDTDRARSTEAATKAIFGGLSWLGLDWDAEPKSQFDSRDRHAEVAQDMLDRGTAYRCFSSQDEIEAFRETARAAGTSTLFQSPWRDVPASDHPDAPSVIRLKAPTEGATEIDDAVQGSVTWKNQMLDDLVLLRSDGTPTYMLAVVVDDHDMGITHVIRGDDHLTNAARQKLIYDAAGWPAPVFAHIPLIHGPDGKKLSKRHGADGVEEYRDMGYPPEAMRNYLSRLGWSHGDDEFFSTKQAIEWFGLDGIGKAPARFDFKKLNNLSGQHIRATDDADLMKSFEEFAATQHDISIPGSKRDIFAKCVPFIKERSKTFHEMWKMAQFALVERPLPFDDKAQDAVNSVSDGILNRLTSRLQNATWAPETLEAEVRAFAEDEELKLGAVAQPLRAALTGCAVSPGVFHVMETLGREESLARLEDVIG